ncbi:hypothetical protein ODZ84_07625 [Chryseobacterium fluminis]|nr:hypothetical protein [Chryseobacterium sp. MMS21-Ot14]UZT99422.1 hypothetical protein ODZ84_07625 [Chryseobacterium sp. MMS21-Ot14]
MMRSDDVGLIMKSEPVMKKKSAMKKKMKIMKLITQRIFAVGNEEAGRN